jgi:hypothetical protein
MTHRRTLRFSSLLALWAATALGQPAFNVIPGTEPTAEGGNVSILLVQTGQQRFSLRLPKNYGVQVRQADQRIVFTSATGSSVITVQWSTNYPGSLPKTEILRDTVAARHPAASLVQTSPCYSQYASGLMFDLFQPTAGNLTLRMRDAYVSTPAGSFEFTLSCDLADYDKARLSFAWLLNSFRSAAEAAKKEP